MNEKDAEKYVEGFADSVQVFVGSQMKVDGRESLIKSGKIVRVDVIQPNNLFQD